VIKLSTTVYVDLGLVFFTTASLLGLARWREGGFPTRTLVWAALFCGLAMGTKYNGLVSFALLTLMVPLVYLKGNPGAPCLQWKALWQGMVFGAVALVAFSPWMLRNIVWTGNPVYPLYQNVFAPRPVGDSISDPEPEDGESGPPPKEAVRWTPFNIRSVIYGESKWRIASIPIRVFFEGKDDDPRHFDGVLSPFLLLFPLGLLLKPSGGRPMAPGMSGMFFLFSAFFLLVVFFKQDMRVRWILPIVPPLVILSVGGMHRIAHLLGTAWPRVAPFRHHLVVVAGMICVLGVSVPYVHDSFAKVKPFEYISGKVGRDDYILRFRPEYAAIQYANRFVPASERILAVYLGNRGYYFERSVLFSNRFVEDFVAPFSRKEEIGERIRGEGVRFLLVNMAFLEKRASESLDGDRRRLLSGFFSADVETVFFRSGHGLFRLRTQ
jgi:hypothetical protein